MTGFTKFIRHEGPTDLIQTVQLSRLWVSDLKKQQQQATLNREFIFSG